jgi:glutathione synthase/RimK-type ligase-like ATP-grasp enzyme
LFRQIIVFTRDQNLLSCRQFAQLAKKKKIPCVFFNPFDMPSRDSIDLTLMNETLIMPRTSGVLFDDWDLTLLEEMILRGATSTHSPSGIAILRDKDRQYLHLIRNEINCVPTLIHRGPLEVNHLTAFCDSKNWVLKANRGNKGIGHQLLSTNDLLDFWKVARNRNDQRYIIQPFYEDIVEQRLLVIGDDQFLLTKKPGDSWKKNASTSQFCATTPSPEQARELDIISKAIKNAIGLNCFAVDLFVVNKKENTYQVLEVNAHPGMSAASEALSEVNLYELFLNYYLES